MGLFKAKKGMKEAPKAEMDGAPSLSIAYSVQKKNKKMAKGGEIKYRDAKLAADDKEALLGDHGCKHCAGTGIVMAEGGTVDPSPTPKKDQQMNFDDGEGSITEILSDNDDPKKMAEGGMVDSEEDGIEGPATDRSQLIAAKKENYSNSGPDFTYSDSGEKGDSLSDADDNDHISRIISKMRAKRGA